MLDSLQINVPFIKTGLHDWGAALTPAVCCRGAEGLGVDQVVGREAEASMMGTPMWRR